MTRIAIIFAFFLFSAFSCSKEEETVDPLEKFPAYVTAVEAPETATVGSTVPIKVYFQVNNSCGGFKRFDVTQQQDTTHIKVYPQYREGPCLMYLPVREEVYEFKPTAPGTYIFKFSPKYPDQQIVKTIVVSRAEQGQ